VALSSDNVPFKNERGKNERGKNGPKAIGAAQAEPLLQSQNSM
jgi:hypothetical protein